VVNGQIANIGKANFESFLLDGGGSLVNRGTIEIGNNGQLQSTLENESMIRQTGTGNFRFNTGAHLINHVGATYDFRSGSGITSSPIDTTPLFDNRGLVRKSDDSLSVIGVPSLMFGDVSVVQGAINFRRDASFQNVEVSIAELGEIKLESGQHDFDGTTVVIGDGTFSISGSTAVNIHDVMTVNLPTGGFEIEGGTTDAIANLVIHGVARWSSGVLSGMVINRGMLEILTNSFHDLREANLSNEGDIRQTGQRVQLFDSIIENTSGATYDAATDVIVTTAFGSSTHQFNNAGQFIKSAGTGVSGFAADFVNTGTARFQSGTINFSRDYRQTAGTSELNGGQLGGFQNFRIEGGELNGSGDIQGNLFLDGRLNPGGIGQTGSITVSGFFEQSSSGRLDIEIGGTTLGQFDQLTTGTGVGNQTTTLAGTLDVQLIDGFIPQLNDEFDILIFDQVVGDHESKNGLQINGGLVLQDELTPTAQKLTASAPIALANTTSQPNGLADPLTLERAQTLLAAAVDQWIGLGIPDHDAAPLLATRIDIVDLPENRLALSGGNRILLDVNAAGWGWFADQTPHDDSEFESHPERDALFATAGSPADQRVDLLSVLMHELGHLLGADHHDEPGQLMSEEISLGMRFSLDPGLVDELF
ncbi:MAG: matrixin family metalloprotease, partial [Planctomycetota bacterium]